MRGRGRGRIPVGGPPGMPGMPPPGEFPQGVDERYIVSSLNGSPSYLQIKMITEYP